MGAACISRTTQRRRSTPEQILDQHIAAFFRAVRELHLPAAAIRQRVAEWIASPPPDHFLLIEPDADAREILLTEIRQLTDWPVSAISVEDVANPDALLGAVPLCRPSQDEDCSNSFAFRYRAHPAADSIGEPVAPSGASLAQGRTGRSCLATGSTSGTLPGPCWRPRESTPICW